MPIENFRPSGTMKKIKEKEQISINHEKNANEKSKNFDKNERNKIKNGINNINEIGRNEIGKKSNLPFLEPLIKQMSPEKLKETLDILLIQLEKTENDIEKQKLKIAFKKKTKHYEL